MVSDQDIELLEASLDAQLSPQEQAALEIRLAGSPELSQALAGLAQERQARSAAWESLAFTEASVDHAIGRLQQSLDRRSWFQGFVGQWQRLGVAAACLAMFATGMYFRDTYAGSGQRPAFQMAPQPVNAVVNQGGSPTALPQFEFRVNDGAGQPIFSQRFRTIEEAESYLARVRMQQRLTSPQPLP